jgi:hypothetical protein
MRDGIQLSEAITGDGAAIFRHACWMDPRRHRLQEHRFPIRLWPDTCMAETKNPDMIWSNLDHARGQTVVIGFGFNQQLGCRHAISLHVSQGDV